MRGVRLMVGLFGSGWGLAAQPPAVSQNGVVNEASQIAPTLPGGALARGALFEIRGVRLSTQDGATTVQIVKDQARIPVTVLSATPRRVECLLPLDAPVGPANVAVSVRGQTGAPFPVEIVASNPGLFSRNAQGWGPGRIDNLDARGGRSENSRANPARPGQRVSLAATGLNGVHTIRVFAGGRPALASVRKSGHAGEDQLVFAIRTDAPRGCNVPVYVLAAPKRASNVVTVAIEPGQRRCQDAILSASAPGRFLASVFTRTLMKAADSPVESLYDEGIVSFASASADTRPSPLMLLPPPGTCAAYSGSFQTAAMLPDSPSAALVSELGATGLDAGPALTVTRDGASRSVPGNPSSPGFFRARLGGREVRFGPRSLAPFLDPGEYRLVVPGGRDIAAFEAQFTGPRPLEWINRDQTTVVDRGRPLLIQWRGAPADSRVIILATNVDQVSTATGTVLCAALPNQGRFTIGPELLANLPASLRQEGGIPYDRLFVGTLPATPTRVNAAGLDAGAIVSLYLTGRFVEYR